VGAYLDNNSPQYPSQDVAFTFLPGPESDVHTHENEEPGRLDQFVNALLLISR
jgi:hypothetical protein